MCDLIMKGGVTSGIVYPEAIYQISRVFDLKSIGGTSAGAIAAALAAAAQYRRVRAPATGEAGYDRVRTVPDVLSTDNRLFKLFTPNAATRALFNIVVDLFNPRVPRWLKVLCLVRAYAWLAAVGAAPAVLYAFAAVSVPSLWMRVVHWLVAIIIAVIGAMGAGVIGLLWDALRKLPRNCFGLATGIADDPKDTCALGTWLTQELEATAGLEPERVPLTFGMLWQPGANIGPCEVDEPPQLHTCAVNLQMVTTSLTEGRPYQFPTSTAPYYFNPDELSKFFPAHVIRWMCDHARKTAATANGLMPLPPIGDLPVVVATRMSLAFPILLSAVPLYAMDPSDSSKTPQRVWFSDGGLTSNFPIAMFDAPLPRWPTLALNFGAFEAQTPADGVVVASSRGPGRLLQFSQIAGVPGFLVALFNALQNWNDNMQATLPGFRDRIATIALSPDEGGLNLDMDAATVERLRERGAAAAQTLIDRFAAPSVLGPGAAVLSWEGHRWTRFRVEFATLNEHLARYAVAYEGAQQMRDVTYAQLIDAGDPHTIPLRSYPIGEGAAGREAAQALATATAALAGQFTAAVGMQNAVPQPMPSLVIRPNLSH